MSDLNALSLVELKILKKEVEKAISTFERRKKADAVKALGAAAKAHGYSLADLLPDAAGSAKKATAKYRNPYNPTETWSGRGRHPYWYREAVADGRDMSELEIS